MLREEGRKAGDRFLIEHGDDIGKTSTLDIDQLLAEMQ
jgi:NTE family protein